VIPLPAALQLSARRLRWRWRAHQIRGRLEANARLGLEAQVQMERAAVPSSANVTLTREPGGNRCEALARWRSG
jgi:hypothetical protein